MGSIGNLTDAQKARAWDMMQERLADTLIECIKCHTLVPESQIYAGVCRSCPPPKTKEIAHDPR